MAVPQFSAGKLTANALNAAFGYVPLMVIKSANEIVNNSATYQDDNELAIAAAAGITYGWSLAVFSTSGTTPDIKMQMTAPSGTSWGYGMRMAYNTAGTFEFNPFTGGILGATYGAGSVIQAAAEGTFVTGGTAGTLRLQWAQNTANASDTTVHAGSWLRLWRV